MKKIATLMTILFLVALALAFGTPARPVGATFEDAAATYKAKCASCHGLDGSGNTALGKSMKLAALGSPAVQKKSDDALFTLIAKGKGKMPTFEKTLGAATCKALVAHIRKMKK